MFVNVRVASNARKRRERRVRSKIVLASNSAGERQRTDVDVEWGGRCEGWASIRRIDGKMTAGVGRARLDPECAFDLLAKER